MRNSSSPVDLRAVTLGAVVLGGLILAIFGGRAVASGNYRMLAMIAGGAVAVFIPLIMQQRVWMLIPATMLITGNITALPLPFSVKEIGILAAFGSFLVFSLMKKIDRPAPLGWVDGLLIANLVYLITAFIRNPAGTLVFQTDIVGGRPYVNVLLSVLAFWVLQRVTIAAKTAFWLPALTSAGGIVTSGLGILTARFPSLVPIIYPIYSGVSIENYMAEESAEGPGKQAFGASRETDLLGFANTIIPCVIAYTSPFRLALFISPLRSILFYAAIAGMLLSGFRSGIFTIGAFILLASYFREGLIGAVRIVFFLVLGLLLLIMLNTGGMSLPMPVQRALSFLPGAWEETAVGAAESSTEWRVDMWRTALTSDKYIKSKVFGDGFGYDIKVFQAFVARTSAGGSGISTEIQQEYFMITGAYHSGPVSAIRYVGVVGLILFTALLVAMAVYAWKLIRATKGTPYFPAALFFGIAVIFKPIGYWFIFGAFEGDFPQAILALAFLNLVSRSFAAWKKEAETKSALSTPSEIAPVPV